jgi:hypothetical protein
MENDISTVGGLIEYLKTLPQEAAVYVADGQSYRLQEDYPDWNEDLNVKFPLHFVWIERGLRIDARKEQLVRSPGNILNPEAFFDTLSDEPETIVTLVGCR